MTSTPTSIQASLSRWFALQTFVGLSAICVVIYALTAWSFQLKQQDEFERHVELVVHLLNEPRSDSQQLAFQHKLDDFFRSHNDIGIVLYAGGQTVYESKPAESSTRWRWTSTDLRDKAPQLGIDPLWFAVLVLTILQTSYLTPPMAPSIFYLRSIAPKEITYMDMYRGVIPFLAMILLTGLVVYLIPWTATWLPQILFRL